MKRSVIFFCLISMGAMSMAQPFINSVDPISAGFDEIVTISGSGFSDNANQNTVYLGAGRVTTIESATDNLLIVRVPSNATSGPITVLNNTTGLTASFSTNFVYAYGSTNAFSRDNFRDQDDIATGEVQTYDVCTCDLDLDGLNDLVVTNNEVPSSSSERSELLVYLNTSTRRNTSFSGPSRLGNRPTIKVTCGDLNGDGFPDIVATEGAQQRNEVFIYQNDGTGNFPSSPSIRLEIPRDENNNIRLPETVEIADMDGDGFLDIVVGNGSNNEIDIFRNRSSSGGDINFSNASSNVFQITIINDGTAIRGLALGDMNGDNTPEIVVSEISEDNLYILRNESTRGDFAFSAPVNVSLRNSQLRNIELGDFNGDGFMDIAATDVRIGSSNGNIVIAENTTTSVGQIPTFDEPFQIPTLANIWGLSTGDIDGDGDLDIAAASESVSTGVIFLNNGSTTLSSATFSSSSYPLNFNSRNIGIADMNGDSKSDLFFTSNSITGQDGFVSVKVNENCVIPTITPDNGIYCNGDGTTIEATHLNGASYTWNVNSVDQSVSVNELDISSNNSDLSINVTLSSVHDGCSQTSGTVNFDNSSVATATPTITTSPASVCAGTTLTLSTDAVARSYFWTGPNDLETEVTTSSFNIRNIGAEQSGRYTLRTQETNSSCLSQPVTIDIEVFSVPTLTILNEDEDVFCEGGSATLSARSIGGFSYQWLRNGTAINNETNTSVSVGRSGSYALQLTDNNGCSAESVPLDITEVIPPVATINGAGEICVDIPLNVASNSSGETGFSLDYEWRFFDEVGSLLSTSTDSSTSFTSATAGIFPTRLFVSYESVANCSDVIRDTIVVSDIPNVPVITPNGTEKCPSDSLLLEMPSDYLSYTWIDVTSGRTDTLSLYTDSNSAFATTATDEETSTIRVIGLTPIQCLVTSEIEIQNFLNSGVEITSSEFQITDNELQIPPMTNGVRLVAEGGGDYVWQPGLIFSDSTAATVTVFPRTRNQMITLTGTDINGCRETTSLTLNNSNLLPRTGFSPNGDGQGFECWEILNSSNIAGCTVYIFDSRGRNIQVQDSPFQDDCVWDGTSEGTQVPVGLYYYVMKCDDSQLDQSGTILLAR